MPLITDDLITDEPRQVTPITREVRLERRPRGGA